MVLRPCHAALCAVLCRAVLSCPLTLQIEAVWLQDFSSRIPGYPDIGPCIVIRGKQPCCGLLPAVHMTDNTHVAIPLRAMSKVCWSARQRVCMWGWDGERACVCAGHTATCLRHQGVVGTWQYMDACCLADLVLLLWRPLLLHVQVCSQHWVTAVLPAWQAAAGVVKASKGASGRAVGGLMC